MKKQELNKGTKTFIIEEGGRRVWENAVCKYTCWYFMTDSKSYGYKENEMEFHVFEDGLTAISTIGNTIYFDKNQIDLMRKFLKELDELEGKK